MLPENNIVPDDFDEALARVLGTFAQVREQADNRLVQFMPTLRADGDHMHLRYQHGRFTASARLTSRPWSELWPRPDDFEAQISFVSDKVGTFQGDARGLHDNYVLLETVLKLSDMCLPKPQFAFAYCSPEKREPPGVLHHVDAALFPRTSRVLEKRFAVRFSEYADWYYDPDADIEKLREFWPRREELFQQAWAQEQVRMHSEPFFTPGDVLVAPDPMVSPGAFTAGLGSDYLSVSSDGSLKDEYTQAGSDEPAGS